MSLLQDAELLLTRWGLEDLYTPDEPRPDTLMVSAVTFLGRGNVETTSARARTATQNPPTSMVL